MALSRSPDPGHDVPMVKEGECWKLFHKDFWLRTGLDVPHPKERVEVTEDQKRIIRDTWPLVNGHLSENGILVYLHVFQLHSDIKPVFHMGNVPFDQLAAQPGLKMHAVKFMQAIEVVVENLDSLDDVVAPIFLHLGRRHSYFKNLIEEYFDTFIRGLIYTWHVNIGKAFTEETKDAWSRLFDFVLQHMRFGFVKATEERHAEERAKAGEEEDEES